MTPQVPKTPVAVIGPVSIQTNATIDTTKNQDPIVVEGVNAVGSAGMVLPQAEIDELNAQAAEVARETGAEVTEVPGVGDPQEKGSLAGSLTLDAKGTATAAENLAAEQAAQQQAAAAQATCGKGFEQPRHLHPLNRLKRIQSVLDSILVHMGASSNSPISREDAEELREYLKNGNGQAEDPLDDDDE